MQTTYNRFAGQSVERIAALSDGVFAVAMTLLVLDLKAPAEAVVHGDAELWRALAELGPKVLVYCMSFMTLGIFWVGQQTQLNALARSDRDLTWLNLGFLFAVTLMPFSTGLIGEFIAYRAALVVYWLNILALGLMLLATFTYAARAGLLRDDTDLERRRSIGRRIVIAQSLYAAGAALCVVSTYLSLAAIVLVQLIYVVAPRIGVLRRI